VFVKLTLNLIMLKYILMSSNQNKYKYKLD